ATAACLGRGVRAGNVGTARAAQRTTRPTPLAAAAPEARRDVEREATEGSRPPDAALYTERRRGAVPGQPERRAARAHARDRPRGHRPGLRMASAGPHPPGSVWQ